MTNGKMMHTIPMMIWSAISMAVFASIFISLMTRTMLSSTEFPYLRSDKDMQNKESLLAMIYLGFGEILGGLFIGQIRDYFGNRPAIGA